MTSEKHKNRSLYWTLFPVMVLVLFPSRADLFATGINPNVRKGSDIVMKDRRWPAWDRGTYYCFWYVKFMSETKSSPTFYGGLATKGPDKLPGMFVSYFGPVANVNEGAAFYRHGYGAEGSKGGVNGRPPFLRANAWYRHVLRIFPPVKGAEGKTLVGWWFKDVEKNKWYTHSVVSIALKSPGVHGNGGFVEALAPETVPRAFERRLGYCRVNGKWFKSDTIPTKSPQFFKLIENATVLRYDRAGPDRNTSEKTVLFTTKQPDEPTLDPPAIANAHAENYGDQVLVSWTIPESASPQMKYKIEAFSDPAGKGKPLAAVSAADPHVLVKRLDAGRTVKGVRLTITDIFDQTVSTTIPTEAAKSTPAARAPSLRPGLKYSYHEAPKGVKWEKLPNFLKIEPIKQGLVKAVDDTVRDARYENYAIQYTGYINAPTSGLYVCQLGTCDGSRLKIDGKVIADNDGIHGTTLNQYPMFLEKGVHAFDLSYFKGPKKYLADKIILTWEGPGFESRPIAAGDFRCVDSKDLPLITMPTNISSADTLKDNLVDIRPKIELRGHKVSRIQIYRDRYLMGAIHGDKIDGGFRNILPRGVNNLWARLWYDGANSVDSNILTLEARNKTEGKWIYSQLGEERFPLAVRSDKGVMSFRGDGVCLAYQKIAGDFTLSARISDMGLRTNENGYHGRNLIGLLSQKDLARPFGRDRFAIYSLAEGRIKGGEDFPDLGGGYCSMVSFPGDRRWLRLIRRGVRFQSFISKDGEVWEKAMDRICRSSPDELCVGPFFRAVPGKSRSLYKGALDNITLTRNTAKLPPAAKVRKTDLPRAGQMTAVIQDSLKPEILYARTNGKGVLKSTDRGDTWTPLNAGLSMPDVLAVRSIAVHPKNSSLMLRGSGRIVGEKLKSSLHRSTDAGKTWKLVSREIDFAGFGPTTAFGEVIAFCEERPEIAVAGGETGGLYLSLDSGATWKSIGLKGRRIACARFVPDSGGVYVVGTIDDREFANLGLGKPYGKTGGAGCVYWSELRDVKKPRISLTLKQENFGVTDVCFGVHPNFATISTTRGVFYTWARGRIFSQRKENMPGDVFYAAVGDYRWLKQTRPGEKRIKVNTYAAPFNSIQTAPVYRVKERMTARWNVLSKAPKVDGKSDPNILNAGVTCILPDRNNPDGIYLCNRNGLFKSVDAGKTYKMIYAN